MCVFVAIIATEENMNLARGTQQKFQGWEEDENAIETVFMYKILKKDLN